MSEPVQRTIQATPGTPDRCCPSLDDLAAFVDGRPGEGPPEALETHLLTCPACLEAVCAAAASGSGEQEGVSPDLIARLYALAPAIDSKSAARLTLVPPAAWWGLRAAALIAISILGYFVGVSQRADHEPVPPSASASIDPTFGLFDDPAVWAEADALAASILLMQEVNQ